MRSIRSGFLEHFAVNRRRYYFVMFLLGLGVILGALYADATVDATELGALGSLDFWGAFGKSVSINLRIWFLIVLAGCFAKLRLLSFIAVLAKGFILGFSIFFLSFVFGFKGFLLVLIASLPHVLFVLPLVIYMCICTSGAGLNTKWLIKCGFGGIIIVFLSVIDGFVLPVFLYEVVKLM